MKDQSIYNHNTHQEDSTPKLPPSPSLNAARPPENPMDMDPKAMLSGTWPSLHAVSAPAEQYLSLDTPIEMTRAGTAPSGNQQEIHPSLASNYMHALEIISAPLIIQDPQMVLPFKPLINAQAFYILIKEAHIKANSNKLSPSDYEQFTKCLSMLEQLSLLRHYSDHLQCYIALNDALILGKELLSQSWNSKTATTFDALTQMLTATNALLAEPNGDNHARHIEQMLLKADALSKLEFRKPKLATKLLGSLMILAGLAIASFGIAFAALAGPTLIGLVPATAMLLSAGFLIDKGMKKFEAIPPQKKSLQDPETPLKAAVQSFAKLSQVKSTLFSQAITRQPSGNVEQAIQRASSASCRPVSP